MINQASKGWEIRSILHWNSKVFYAHFYVTLKARREEEIKAAHDEAMFGAPAAPSPIDPDKEPMEDSDGKETNENIPVTNLVSEKVRQLSVGPFKLLFPVWNWRMQGINAQTSILHWSQVLAKQQGTWRDRARKLQDRSTSWRNQHERKLWSHQSVLRLTGCTIISFLSNLFTHHIWFSHLSWRVLCSWDEKKLLSSGSLGLVTKNPHCWHCISDPSRRKGL